MGLSLYFRRPLLEDMYCETRTKGLKVDILVIHGNGICCTVSFKNSLFKYRFYIKGLNKYLKQY